MAMPGAKLSKRRQDTGPAAAEAPTGMAARQRAILAPPKWASPHSLAVVATTFMAADLAWRACSSALISRYNPFL